MAEFDWDAVPESNWGTTPSEADVNNDPETEQLLKPAPPEREGTERVDASLFRQCEDSGHAPISRNEGCHCGYRPAPPERVGEDEEVIREALRCLEVGAPKAAAEIIETFVESKVEAMQEVVDAAKRLRMTFSRNGKLGMQVVMVPTDRVEALARALDALEGKG